jgi:hypothetical protein
VEKEREEVQKMKQEEDKRVGGILGSEGKKRNTND